MNNDNPESLNTTKEKLIKISKHLFSFAISASLTYYAVRNPGDALLYTGAFLAGRYVAKSFLSPPETKLGGIIQRLHTSTTTFPTPPEVQGTTSVAPLLDAAKTFTPAELGNSILKSPGWPEVQTSYQDTPIRSGPAVHNMLLFPTQEDIEQEMLEGQAFTTVTPAPEHAQGINDCFSYRFTERACAVTVNNREKVVFVSSVQERVTDFKFLPLKRWFRYHNLLDIWLPCKAFTSYSYIVKYYELSFGAELSVFYPTGNYGFFERNTLKCGKPLKIKGSKDTHYIQPHRDGLTIDMWSEGVPVSRTVSTEQFYDAQRFYQAAQKPTASTLTGAIPQERIKIIPWVFYFLKDTFEVVPTNFSVSYYNKTYITPLDERNAGTILPETEGVSACVPVLGASADLTAYTERILPGRVQAACSQVSTKHIGYTMEFAEKFLLQVNGGEQLVPLMVSEVLEEKLNEPKHKREMANKAVLQDGVPHGKFFSKNESYQEYKAARPVVSFDVDSKVEYSCYTGALSNALVKTHFYGFVRPAEVEAKLVCLTGLLLSKTGWELIETDFSRFDTTVGCVRVLEEAFLNGVFGRLPSTWAQQLNMKVVAGKFGQPATFKYRAEGERLSGSPETSVMNTLMNALTTYIHLREMDITPAEAYHSLGVYGGDDGVSITPDPLRYVHDVETMGLKVKANICGIGKPVSFLGRYFGDLFTGDGNNCCDPARFYKAMAWSNDSQADPVPKLKQKIISYLVTDPNTPFVLGKAREIYELFGELGDTPDPNNYWTQMVVKTGCPFTNVAASWMDLLHCDFIEANKYTVQLELPDVLDGVPIKPIPQENVIISPAQAQKLVDKKTKATQDTVSQVKSQRSRSADGTQTAQQGQGRSRRNSRRQWFNANGRGNKAPSQPAPRPTGRGGGPPN